MKKIKETEKGFYGCYWPCEEKESDVAIIAMLGDDCEDHVAKSGARWLHKKFGVNVLTLSPAHKDYSHHNLPVERIGASIEYLKSKGNRKFGIAGASTTGMFALIAASYYPEITLTIAMTPSDFVMEGFYQGKRDGMKTKILVLTAEAKEELHESVYEKTIDTIIDGILDLIFEKE